VGQLRPVSAGQQRCRWVGRRNRLIVVSCCSYQPENNCRMHSSNVLALATSRQRSRQVALATGHRIAHVCWEHDVVGDRLPRSRLAQLGRATAHPAAGKLKLHDCAWGSRQDCATMPATAERPKPAAHGSINRLRCFRPGSAKTQAAQLGDLVINPARQLTGIRPTSGSRAS
jgi:hypothetical protein